MVKFHRIFLVQIFRLPGAKMGKRGKKVSTRTYLSFPTLRSLNAKPLSSQEEKVEGHAGGEAPGTHDQTGKT